MFQASPLNEFLDPSRKKICLLDDNFLGFKDWKPRLMELQDTGKKFKFKQGLDERLLTDEKCKLLFDSNYDGEYTFAFDNIADYELIDKKLNLIRTYTDRQIRFYVLCGFDENGLYDEEFWKQDIINTFERIKLLSKHKALPYIMRFNRYEESPHRGIYITMARWINQPSFFKKKSLCEYAQIGGKASVRYLEEFSKVYPEIADSYFHTKFWE